MAHTLDTEQTLPAPLDQVFPFFSDVANLERITPPWLSFRITTPQPIDMREGALIDQRLRVRGVPLKWRSRIAVWDPPHRFVDEQVTGPYRLWRHEHRFEEVPGGTKVSDHVDYLSPGGPLESLITGLVVRRDVEQIFAWRRKVLAEIFGGQEG